jgi:hypothetical protein
LEERYWNHVIKNGEGCWGWVGSTRQGYGKFMYEGKWIYASRFSLERKLGRRLRKGKLALHECDNPPCSKPEHLYEGTHKNNADDAIKRGRWSRRANLTEKQVLEIRKMRSQGMRSIEISRALGISYGNVYGVVTGRTWKELGPVKAGKRRSVGKKSETKFRCVECGKISTGRIPHSGWMQGDLTFRYPRRHLVNGEPCPGMLKEAEWVRVRVRVTIEIRKAKKGVVDGTK